jgi:hypothetical protein
MVWSLAQRSPVECGVPECDREASITRGPWPARDNGAMETCESHEKQRIFPQKHLLTGFYKSDSVCTYEAGIELLNMRDINFRLK